MKRPVFYLRVVFLISLLLLMMLSLLAYNRIQKLLQETNRVEHTYRVLNKVEELLSILKDAETGQRGFLLTHQREFLEPYNQSLALFQKSHDSLRTLLQDNPAQVTRVDTLWGLINRRYELLSRATVFDTSRRGSLLGRLQERNALLVRGKKTMDSLRTMTARIRNEELRLLRERDTVRTDIARLTPTYLLALAAIALVLLSGSFLLLNRELRQRLDSQRELELKVEALNRSNAELEQFAYVASHDLQEPLRKIRAFGSKLVLRHAEGLSPEGRELLDKIEHSAGRMQTLIDDLLSFSRLVKPPGAQVPTDLNQVVQEVLSDLAEPIATRRAFVTVDPLPTLDAQPTQLKQLFQNLLSNALKFSRQDTPPAIDVDYQLVKGAQVPQATGRRRDLNYHRIAISDNGIGFEPQYAEKIFVIFQRLHGRFEYTGTGIGLAVCKRVVANHDGFIEARSTPGEGSTFIVYLPVTVLPQTDLPA
jgi:signal transduction histidine kinase